MGQSPTSLPGGGRRETRQLCAPSSPPAPALPSGAPSRRSAPGTIGSTSPSPPLSCTQRIRTHTIHAHAHHEPSRRHGRNASAGEGLRKNTTSVRRLTGAAAAPSSRPRTGIPHRSTPGDAGAARARPSCLRPRPSPWWCLPPRSPPRRRPPWARATTRKQRPSSCRCQGSCGCGHLHENENESPCDGTDGEETRARRCCGGGGTRAARHRGTVVREPRSACPPAAGVPRRRSGAATTRGSRDRHQAPPALLSASPSSSNPPVAGSACCARRC